MKYQCKTCEEWFSLEDVYTGEYDNQCIECAEAESDQEEKEKEALRYDYR